MKMPTADGGRPGVLIVDDDPLLRAFLVTALEPIARVEQAASAEAALELLEARARTIELAFVDQVLPRASGLEVLQITRRRWPWITVVLLTGFGSEELAVQALRAGAGDYLKKPIELHVLLAAVARLIGHGGGKPSAEAQGPGRSRPGHPSIIRALRFLAQHFTEAVTLAEVARQAGLSRFHFCRLFHHEVGVPFHEHLHRLRVYHAQTLLADPSRRISEVAYAVGFNDLSHFDRTFRKTVGQSPSEYRASLRSA